MPDLNIQTSTAANSMKRMVPATRGLTWIRSNKLDVPESGTTADTWEISGTVVPSGIITADSWPDTELVTGIDAAGWLPAVEIVVWAAVPDPPVAESVRDEV